MCLVTTQTEPKRTWWPMTVYKVVTRCEGYFESQSNGYHWRKGVLETRELGITLDLYPNQCTFANAETMQHYTYTNMRVTEIAEGLHAYLKKIDAIDRCKEITSAYQDPITVVVKMRIPAFSLVFTDECRLIVSNKMRLIREIRK